MTVLFYSGLIFVTAFAGGSLPLLVPSAREDSLKLFLSLGAGLLLGMALLHMLPESAELIPSTFGGWFLFGFVLLFVLERFIMIHACEEHGCHYHTIGIAAFAGLAVHGLIEGFALASSLLVSQLGPVVLIAILSHKIPAGFALTSILKMGSKSRKQILWFNAGVAISGPLGLVLAYLILRNQQVPSSAGILLAISAGTFLYIAACDLIPELHRSATDKLPRLILFFVGIALSMVSGHLLEN